MGEAFLSLSLSRTHLSPLFSMCRQSPPPLSHLISLHLLASWLTITRFLAAKSLPMVCAISQQESKIWGVTPQHMLQPPYRAA
ncbi:hypothetical protein ACB092_05G272500 [Castanea dentata]